MRNVLLVEKLDFESAGAVLMPDTVQPAWTRARVVSAGPGRVSSTAETEGYSEPHVVPRVPMSIQTGDVIWFARQFGTELEYKGKAYLVLTEDEVAFVECSTDGTSA